MNYDFLARRTLLHIGYVRLRKVDVCTAKLSNV